MNGKGPLGVVHVDAFSDNTVRGYVDNPHVEVPLKYAGKLDVGAAVGHDGEVQVTRFTKLRQDYTSQSPMQTGEVAEGFGLLFIYIGTDSGHYQLGGSGKYGQND